MNFKAKVIQKERKQYLKLKYDQYQKKVVTIETVTGWAFLSPLLIVALIFSTSAIVIALYLSFQSGKWDDLTYVGGKNWEKLLNPGLHLMSAFKNTLFYAGVAVPVTIIVSLIVSGVLNSKLVKNKEIFLAIFFLPQVTSAIASTIIFRQLISPDGLIKVDYYAHPKMIMWIVIISAIWGGVAGSLITMNTAFATIDKTQYEAAELDGAGGLKKFLSITIPSIGPIVAYSLFMGIIGGLGVFDGPYLLAGTTGNGEALMTLILKGYSFIIPPSSAYFQNIGLGTTILFATSLLMMVATFLANLFMPLNKKTY